MNPAIIVIVIFWIFSAVSKSAKKRAQNAQQAKPQERQQPSQAKQAEGNAAIRPAHVDLPGQATMHIEPTEWQRMEPIQPVAPKGAGGDQYLEQDAFDWGNDREDDARDTKAKAAPTQEAANQGLRLPFASGSIMQGIVFSEILNRKVRRRLK